MRHEVVAASPNTGVNTITGEGLTEAMAGTQVVIDLANSPSFEDKAVLEFFETSGRNLLAAEAAAGVRHHVALSIVGTDRTPDNGYFRAKVAQEKLIEASGIPYTIIRSTQFLDFLGRIAASSAEGTLVRLARPVPAHRADDVAAIVAEVALAVPRNGIVEIAGPERAPFNEIVARYLKAPRPACGRRSRGLSYTYRVEERLLVPLGEAASAASVSTSHRRLRHEPDLCPSVAQDLARWHELAGRSSALRANIQIENPASPREDDRERMRPRRHSMGDELATSNVNRSYSLAATSIAIFTFILFFLYPRFASGEVNALLCQVMLVVMGVATFSFVFASFYYYGSSLGSRIDDAERACTLGEAIASGCSVTPLLFPDPSLILFSVGLCRRVCVVRTWLVYFQIRSFPRVQTARKSSS